MRSKLSHGSVPNISNQTCNTLGQDVHHHNHYVDLLLVLSVMLLLAASCDACVGCSGRGGRKTSHGTSWLITCDSAYRKTQEYAQCKFGKWDPLEPCTSKKCLLYLSLTIHIWLKNMCYYPAHVWSIYIITLNRYESAA